MLNKCCASAVLAALLILGACSDDTDDGAPASDGSAADRTGESTVPSTAVAAAPPASLTTPPTTTPATTAVAPPTVAPTVDESVAESVAQAYVDVAFGCPDGLRLEVTEVAVTVDGFGTDAGSGTASHPDYVGTYGWVLDFGSNEVTWDGDICSGRDVSGS